MTIRKSKNGRRDLQLRPEVHPSNTHSQGLLLRLPIAINGISKMPMAGGGASPEVGVGNLYTNSVLLTGDKCLTTTFEDPESVYFTSITAYDADRYLLTDVRSINSYRWDSNSDGTITVSFNCGDDAVNNIDTHGQEFSFTVRFYGVSQKAVDGKITPESNVR